MKMRNFISEKSGNTKITEVITSKEISEQIEEFLKNKGEIYKARHGESNDYFGLSMKERNRIEKTKLN